MDNADLTRSMQKMMAEMAAMRAELNDLKARGNVVTAPPVQQKAAPVVSTTRRTALRRLAGGILAGLAIGGVTAALPDQAAAKFVAAKGLGAIIVPPNGTITGSVPDGTVYGLYATSDATTDLTNYGPDTKVGVMGLSTSTAAGSTYYGVFGQSMDYGVYGNSSGGGYGVYGTSVTYGVFGKGNFSGILGKTDSSSGNGVLGEANGGRGVYGTSSSGVGVFASSSSGASLSISPSNEPSGGTRAKGDMYVDLSGNLHIYNGTAWRTVTTTVG